jgi:hypothetical protein
LNELRDELEGGNAELMDTVKELLQIPKDVKKMEDMVFNK